MEGTVGGHRSDVAQASKPAVSPISQSAARDNPKSAGLARKPARKSSLRAAGFLALLLLLAGCQPREKSEGAHLLLSSPFPGPSTTFEVRFDEPMAQPSNIGLDLTNSPLVIQPPLRGAFKWLSARSGVFSPDEALRMDTRYEIRLRPGLRNAAGQPSRAQLRQFARTAPLEISAFTPIQGSENASAEPEIKVVFNSDIRAEDAERYFVFRNRTASPIPAVVRQANAWEQVMSWQVGSDISLSSWREQFQERTASPRARHRRYDTTNAIPNHLIVTPSRRLPVGKGWELVVRAGLPAEGGLRLGSQAQIPVGDVQPFECRVISASHEIWQRPEIRLDFSKAISQTLTNRWKDWIEIQPAVSNLSVSLNGQVIVFAGDFRSGANYGVSLRAGLPALEPLALAASSQLAVTVPHVEPRLYFPEFSSEQLASGNRTFPLQAVNVGRVRVRAKLIESWDAAHVLRGYRSYIGGWGELFRRIDYNVVPGRTVYDTQIEGSIDRDEPRIVDLQWDKVMAGRSNGIVFLEADSAESNEQNSTLGTQAVMQLTDLGVIWKTAPNQTEACVFSYKTGEPVSDAAVRLVSEENAPLGEAVTDASGVARIPTNSPGWLIVEKAGDVHAIATHDHNIHPWSFNLKAGWGNAEWHEKASTLLFGDRTLYRPGETLYLKAISREWTAQGYAIPAGASNHIEFFDSKSSKFFETNLCFNELGALDVAVALPSLARGWCRAELRSGPQTKSYQFDIQDFQPSAFEIVLGGKPSYLPGEKIEIPVSARYYLGKPLSAAQVKWWVEAEDTEFHADAFHGFNFARSRLDQRFGRGNGGVSLTGVAALTASSNLVIRPELPLNPASPQPRSGSVRVEITDINQQTLSRQVDFTMHSSEFYLGLRQEGWAIAAGKSLPLTAAAVSVDGRPWPQAVKARLKLQRVNWEPVRIQGTGKTLRYRNEPVLTNIFEREIELTPAELPARPGDEIKACAIPEIMPEEPGNYLVQLTAKDSQGRDVAVSTEFSVWAPTETAWESRNNMHVALKPAQLAYNPGDTAEIVVEAPFAGRAFVTVERETVLRSFATNLEGNASVIRVPIESGDAPNVFVSVTLVRGGENSPRTIKSPEYRVGYCELAVNDPQHRLAVCLSSPSTNHLPGQTVELTAEIKDSTGAAVPGAEVTLYAVDEGILSLSDLELPDPYTFFYKPRPLLVSSGISLPNLMNEDPEQLTFHNKGYTGGDGGGASRVRKNFKACAFWNATLRTGEDGRVTAHFTAPDSLTRYRVVAVAQTVHHQFGSSQSALQVSKPLVIEPALPRFATLGDRIQARAIILNQTAQAGDVMVSLQLDCRATNATQLTKRVPLAAKGSAVVEFPLELIDTGAAVWVWKARFADPSSENFTDAVQSTLNVGELAPLVRETLFARCASGETNLLAAADPRIAGGQGSVTVSIANTRLNDLGEAVSQLLHYPYGCVEQTSSSMLPWLVLRDTPGLLASVTNRSQTVKIDPEGAVRAGVARLFTMQTGSGGLGYWPHDREPMYWGSAYGGMVLAMAKRHGAEVPEDEFKRLLEYLSQELRGSRNDRSLSDDCLALYALALAGSPEPAYQEKLFALRGKLSSEDRALLALAISESGGAAAMADELLDPGPIRTSEQEFFCPGRELGIRLLAWVVRKPEDPSVDALVIDLLSGREWAHWGTTQGNAWGLLGLAEYARRVEKTWAPVEAVLRCGGESVTFKLDHTNHVFTRAFPLTTNNASPSIFIVNDSTNCLYASATLEARPKVARPPRQDRGFSISRRYSLLDDANHAQDIGKARVGDRVLVTLTLSTRQRASYVVLDDPLPSVLEAINPEFNSHATVGLDPSSEADDLPCNYRELRTDRALFFVNYLPAGDYSVHYLARVRAAGTVSAPAAKAEEMYHPNRYGLCEVQTITTTPLE